MEKRKEQLPGALIFHEKSVMTSVLHRGRVMLIWGIVLCWGSSAWGLRKQMAGEGTSGCGPTGPTATFSFAGSDLMMNFQNTSRPGSGPIDAWRWEFGDGTTNTTDWSPSHTYASAGTYTVRLIVWDSNNLSSSITKNVTVTAPLPTVSMQWRGTLGESLTSTDALHFTLHVDMSNIGSVENKKLGFIGPTIATAWLHRCEMIGNVSGAIPAGRTLEFHQLISKVTTVTLNDGSSGMSELTLNKVDPISPLFAQTRLTLNGGIQQIYHIDAPGTQTSSRAGPTAMKVSVNKNFLTWVTLDDGTNVTPTKLRWHQHMMFTVNPDGSFSFESDETKGGASNDSRIPVTDPSP